MSVAELTSGAAVFATVIVLAGALRPRRRRTIAPATASPEQVAGSPTARRRRVAAITATTVVVLLLAGPFAAMIVVAAGALRTPLARRRDDRRRAVATETAFPDFVDLLVLTVRSGCTPVQAFRSLADVAPAPLRPAVVAVVSRIDGGERFADAVSTLPAMLGATAQQLGDALALADRHGTPLAPTLDRLADDARARRRRNAEVAARQLPIRLSFPLVGCTLPSFVLLTIVPLMAGTLSSLPGLHP